MSRRAKGSKKKTQENLKKGCVLEGLAGILPLVPLAAGGAQRDVVEEIIGRLMQPEELIRRELLALTRLFASLAFKSQEDQEWLKRRFEMLKDILRETLDTLLLQQQ